ncbi:PAS domain-containing protein [Mucilaginibacter achroorhodeus]|uniref:PAS domain-containing protein n=1 Tax=Mucilaginibacter achroorhodeus TaxID=2599294 RepID=A0A563U4H3_9SPHI|nr:PAS domain-containing protein [Mucilaginibacter achroorhodeus]TWR26241.1 PAS domain-containing protein [Mucilaginibacter achroorhodeus]
MTEYLFRALFDQLAEPRIILKPDHPTFTVVSINSAYEQATGYKEEQLKGRSVWDFFKADAAGSFSAEKLKQGLEDVLRHSAEIKLPIFRFDLMGGAGSSPRWWQVELYPIIDENNSIVYITCTTHNVTIHVEDQANILESRRNEAAMLIQQQQSEKELQVSEHALRVTQDELSSERSETENKITRRTKELSDSEYRLNRIIANTPTGLCILKSDELIIEIINQSLLKLWGRVENDVIGKSILTAVPEFEGQPFVKRAKQVLGNGNQVTSLEEAVLIIKENGKQETRFADFSYDPLFDVNDKVESVLITVNDVTEIVKAKQLLQHQQEELETTNEELTAANEELQSMNEELHATNEQLAEVNQLLEEEREKNSD